MLGFSYVEEFLLGMMQLDPRMAQATYFLSLLKGSIIVYTIFRQAFDMQRQTHFLFVCRIKATVY